MSPYRPSCHTYIGTQTGHSFWKDKAELATFDHPHPPPPHVPGGPIDVDWSTSPTYARLCLQQSAGGFFRSFLLVINIFCYGTRLLAKVHGHHDRAPCLSNPPESLRPSSSPPCLPTQHSSSLFFRSVAQPNGLDATVRHRHCRQRQRCSMHDVQPFSSFATLVGTLPSYP